MGLNFVYFAEIFCAPRKNNDFWINVWNISLRSLLIFNVVFAEFVFKKAAIVFGSSTVASIVWALIFLIPGFSIWLSSEDSNTRN
jgi:hypothetical protein